MNPGLIKEPVDLASFVESCLEKIILDKWNKVKDTFKETTFEQFHNAYAKKFWYGGNNVIIDELGLK